MRRTIVLADVCLDLDDRAGSQAGVVNSNEARADQRSRGVECGLGEERAIKRPSPRGPG
jgi:hypothetical protein